MRCRTRARARGSQCTRLSLYDCYFHRYRRYSRLSFDVNAVYHTHTRVTCVCVREPERSRASPRVSRHREPARFPTRPDSQSSCDAKNNRTAVKHGVRVLRARIVTFVHDVRARIYTVPALGRETTRRPRHVMSTIAIKAHTTTVLLTFGGP